MARKVEQIEADIRELAVGDRDRLIRDLIADMDGSPAAAIDTEALWVEEAQKRYDELRSGTAKAVPADEAVRAARARLGHGS